MPETDRLSPGDLARFRGLIHDRSGLDFPPSRQADLEQVLGHTLRRSGLRDADALFALLTDGARGEPILQATIASLTVGETYFFRHQPQFHALERHILPELIARRRPTRQLRLWSAGCATGEEPYSLAILLERLLPDLADWNILLLATDLNPHALAKAQQGCYGEWSFRHVPAEIKANYFVARGAEFEIDPRLRSRVTFARLNLVEEVFPSFHTQTCGLDLILCRNVLIYFRDEMVRRVAGRFYQSLAEDGWLVVGHAEASQAVFERFTAQNFPGTVVYRKTGVKTQESVVSGQWSVVGRETPVLSVTPDSQDLTLSKEAGAPPRRVPCVRPDPPQAERSPYQEARQRADRRQWEQAEEWIALALEREPLSAPVHYLHGLILLERAQPEAALAALRRCVYADAGFVLGHVTLADLHARQGQKERARKSLETVGRLLAGRHRQELVPEGDGLTVGRLLEVVRVRQQQA